uniref:Uncharacterized protein n=1 Tax=Oryza brachyantha TaxID=4533 RepID=J3KZ59_ORYBR
MTGGEGSSRRRWEVSAEWCGARRPEGSGARSRAAAGKRHAGAAAPVPASRLEYSAPASRRKISARPVSYGSAWGGKRNCGGQDELPRQVRSVADHGRRVFGQLNIGEEGVELEQANLQNRGSVCVHRIGASKPATVDDKITHSTLPVPAGTEDGGCVAGRRRRRRRSRRNMGSN